ncbi:MAG TPA: hypothetical protein VFE32_02520 [Puia sp.]|nr:hypothetical protein [Puia sp.]
MKQFLVAAVLLTAATTGYGQCEKKTVLTASKTDHLAADSSLERSEDGVVTIEFDKTIFNVNPPNESPLSGKVDSVICNWATPYKEGKTRMKITLTNSQGETQHFTVTIEGKAGKVVLYATMDGQPDQNIRLVADKFEPAKL